MLLMLVLGVALCSGLAVRLVCALSPAVEWRVLYWTTYARAWAVWLLTDGVWRGRWLRHVRGRLMGPRPGDVAVSTVWMTRILRAAGVLGANSSVASATVSTKDMTAGFVGATCRVLLTYRGATGAQTPASVVLKMHCDSAWKIFFSMLARSAREAWFYNHVGGLDSHGGKDTAATRLRLDVLPHPHVFYAHGSFVTGRYLLVMEYVSDAIQCMPLLGNNFLPAPAPPPGAPTEMQVYHSVIKHLAQQHARHWCDARLLACAELGGVALWQGRDRARHELARNMVAIKWRLVEKALAKGGRLHGRLRISQHFVQVMKAAIAATNWDTFRAVYNPKSLPYTLCHGDVHSGNLMWRLTRGQYGADPGLLAIDWPDVGIRHGATELAMFFITNPTPEFRRRHEREFMQLYWRTLTEHERVSKEEYPFDMCWDRYIKGGIERWLQMLTFILHLCATDEDALPVAIAQWYHDQVAAFLDDHATLDRPYILNSLYCFG